MSEKTRTLPRKARQQKVPRWDIATSAELESEESAFVTDVRVRPTGRPVEAVVPKYYLTPCLPLVLLSSSSLPSQSVLLCSPTPHARLSAFVPCLPQLTLYPGREAESAAVERLKRTAEIPQHIQRRAYPIHFSAKEAPAPSPSSSDKTSVLLHASMLQQLPLTEVPTGEDYRSAFSPDLADDSGYDSFLPSGSSPQQSDDSGGHIFAKDSVSDPSSPFGIAASNEVSRSPSWLNLEPAGSSFSSFSALTNEHLPPAHPHAIPNSLSSAEPSAEGGPFAWSLLPATHSLHDFAGHQLAVDARSPANSGFASSNRTSAFDHYSKHITELKLYNSSSPRPSEMTMPLLIVNKILHKILLLLSPVHVRSVALVSRDGLQILLAASVYKRTTTSGQLCKTLHGLA
ncbi:hypothetical protein BDK51DRAFT_48242 [Blyttiomyces helicus]|uniref:Uncharacterized protein n=1 Tax=Blyttiomyces helicus TaxID=388810 RepID=A0A4P9W206_9FUNG|nr:hypothetical protein BDK51DRAFT_48242 [Blyttiomyces helicus]|eukprot:RKO85203.1 hypothetical protein BDK51DRAFT_48242 [Blyttiomyces helicus]